MLYLYTIIFVIMIPAFGTGVMAVDDTNRPNRWFEPRTGNYVHYEMNQFQDIPLESRLIERTSNSHNTLANNSRHRWQSLLHNPKFVGVVLGIMMIILGSLIYVLVERVKTHEE